MYAVSADCAPSGAALAASTPGPPAEFRRTIRLGDGREVLVAPLTPVDAEDLGEAMRHADPDTLYRRFCGSPPRITPELLRHLTELDYRTRFALIARDRDGTGVAEARYEPTSRAGVAEVAVAVDPGWRRVGLATALLRMLAEAAQAIGIHEFTAVYLPSNRPVIELLDEAGGRQVIGDGIARAVVRLGEAASDAPTARAAQAAVGGGTARSPRLPHIDNLKAIMVAWIVGGHALLGYAAIGGWEYAEVREVTFGPRLEFVLTAALGPSALIVIGAFFFLAGLFVPRALAKRGQWRFLHDRVLRLGLPYLAFAVLLWPLLVWLTYRAAGRPVTYWWAFAERDPLLDAGALWFVLVLLIFNVGYAGLVLAGLRPPRRSSELRGWQLVALAAAVTVVTFVLRIWLPARSTQLGDLHLWQWPQCAALFGLGIAVSSTGLAQRVPDRLRRGSGLTVLATVTLLPVLAAAAGVSELGTDAGPFLGGWRWQALATATVEGTLVVAGSVWLLGMAQRRLTRHGRIAGACARSAYAAFILQGPVLLSLAMAIRPIPAPAEVKAFSVAGAGIVLTFWLGWLLVTRTRLGRIL